MFKHLNREAFKHYYDSCFGQLFAFFTKRGYPREAALESVQETYLRAYKSRNTFRGEAPFEQFLLAIALNLWKEEIRKNHTQKRSAQLKSLEEIFPDGSVSPQHNGQIHAFDEQFSQLFEAEKHEYLVKAVQRLSPQRRNCIRLHLFQHKSYREISQILQMAEGTVKATLNKAKQVLKVELAEFFGTENSPPTKFSSKI